jgi:SAM-dependent methyltransferase
VDLAELQRNWDALGRFDAHWAVLTDQDQNHLRWEIGAFEASGRGEVDLVERMATELGVPLARDRALDFGCGVGRVTLALAERWEHVVGVDIAPSMLEAARARNRAPGRVEYVLNEGSDLAVFDDASFDLIFCKIVLQHMAPEYAEGYLREFVRVLAPGGLAVVQVPSEPEPVASLTELPLSAALAHIVLADVPLTLEIGTLASIRVHVRNDGDTTWPAHGAVTLLVGNHWRLPGRPYIEDDGRSHLPSDVPPGTTVEVRLVIRAPLYPGDWRLDVDLVAEGQHWFSDVGSKAATRLVRVVLPPEPDDRLGRLRRRLSPARRAVETWWHRRRGPDLPPEAPPDTEPIVMEMHGIPADHLEAVVTESGGRVLRAERDLAAPGWRSATYYITR